MMVSKVAEFFSQSTATGRALKSILNALLAPLSGEMGALAPVAKRFFQGLVIGALLATIGVLTLKKSAEKVLDFKFLKNVDTAKLALQGGAAAAIVLASGLALAAAGAALLAAPLIAGTAAVYGAIYGIIRGVVAIYDSITSIGWSATGGKIVSGIFNGLTAGMN
jgi:poly(A) polymerase Pap1